jgi:seryl-tRNA synthetase
MAVRTRAKGSYVLSGRPELSETELASLREELSEVLMRGVPKERAGEGAVLRSLELRDNRLSFEVECGTLVWATDAVLRMRNAVAERLGKSHRIGVRGVEVERLEVKVSGEPVDRAKASEELSGVAEVSSTDGELIIVFSNLTESELQDRVVERAIKRVRVTSTKEEIVVPATFGTVLKSGSPRPQKVTTDVGEVAESLGWIKRFPGRGQWIYTPPMAALLRSIINLIIERVCLPLGFQEWVFPRLLPMEVFEKLSTYVEHLPEGLFYVCPPPRDPQAFSEFKREYSLRRELRVDLLRSVLEDPRYVLDAVQCPPFYQFFSNEYVRLEDLPVKAFDVMGGWTWRNEAGGVEGIVRTNEFLRMEMVFLSSPEDAVELRDTVVDRVVELIDKDLDLEWRVVAGAPFYLSPEEARKRVIDISTSAKIPTLDVEVYMEYRGPRDKAEWLEITAATVHRDFYVNAFRIREVKGRRIWTGCVGHGITRWAAAFLARHGFDPSDWPKAIRSQLRYEPKPPRTVR